MNKTEQLETMDLNKLIINLSAPAIISFLISTLNLAVDRIFIGKAVGSMALAAVTVAMGIQTLIQGFSQLIASGATTYISILIGKKRTKDAERILGNALLFSIISSIVITVFICIVLKPILKLYGTGNELMEYALPYTLILILSSVLFVIAQVLNNVIRGMGFAKTATVNFLASIVVNLTFDAIFLIVLHTGVIGAALSTAMGYVVSSTLAFKFLRGNKSTIRLKKSCLNIEKSLILKILSMGLPAFVMQLALSLITLVYSRVCNDYGGPTVQAAYGVINTISMIIYMPIMGLSMGIQSIISINYGSGLYERVKETVLKSIKFATIFSVFMCIVMELFSNSLAAIFEGTDSAQLISITAAGIRATGITVFTIGFQMIVINYFQYVGKPKKSVLLTSLRQLILIIPLVIILPMFFGVSGIFYSQVFADAVSCVVVVILFIKEMKSFKVCNDKDQLIIVK